jgi:hypothetical protein
MDLPLFSGHRERIELWFRLEEVLLWDFCKMILLLIMDNLDEILWGDEFTENGESGEFVCSDNSRTGPDHVIARSAER